MERNRKISDDAQYDLPAWDSLVVYGASEVRAIASMPLVGALAPKFVAIDRAVMRGSEWFATARSHTMAKRIANALNNHKANSEGV